MCAPWLEARALRQNRVFRPEQVCDARHDKQHQPMMAFHSPYSRMCSTTRPHNIAAARIRNTNAVQPQIDIVVLKGWLTQFFTASISSGIGVLPCPYYEPY